MKARDAVLVLAAVLFGCVLASAVWFAATRPHCEYVPFPYEKPVLHDYT